MPKKIVQPRKHTSRTSSEKGRRRRRATNSPRRGVSKNEGRYGTSKLESYFAKNFLDKFGVRYVYEYEAKDIGRFYDFAIVAVTEDSDLVVEEKNGIVSISQSRNYVRPCLIIEVDGSYFHGDPRLVEEKELNAMQRKNKAVDEYKDEWCRVHHIPILRIWEYDIINNPSFVMDKIGEAIRKLDSQDRIKIRRKKKFLSRNK